MSSPSEPAGETPRRLYRSRSERMVSGVCGGLAEYFNVDPTLVRLAFVLLTLANGVGVILYIIAAFIVPLNPSTTPIRGLPLEQIIPKNLATIITLAIGVIILIVGVSVLFFLTVPWNPWFIFTFIGNVMGPLVLIIIGIVVLFVGLSSARKKTQ